MWTVDSHLHKCSILRIHDTANIPTFETWTSTSSRPNIPFLSTRLHGRISCWNQYLTRQQHTSLSFKVQRISLLLEMVGHILRIIHLLYKLSDRRITNISWMKDSSDLYTTCICLIIRCHKRVMTLTICESSSRRWDMWVREHRRTDSTH